MPNNLQIAQTIIKQLGGSGRLTAMIGARSFVAGDDYVDIRFTAKAANKSNLIKVALNSNDLYDVTFLSLTWSGFQGHLQS